MCENKDADYDVEVGSSNDFTAAIFFKYIYNDNTVAIALIIIISIIMMTNISK